MELKNHFSSGFSHSLFALLNWYFYVFFFSLVYAETSIVRSFEMLLTTFFYKLVVCVCFRANNRVCIHASLFQFHLGSTYFFFSLKKLKFYLTIQGETSKQILQEARELMTFLSFKFSNYSDADPSFFLWWVRWMAVDMHMTVAYPHNSRALNSC